MDGWIAGGNVEGMDGLQGKYKTSGTMRFEEGGSNNLRDKWYLVQVQWKSLEWWGVWKTFCVSRVWGSSGWPGGDGKEQGWMLCSPPDPNSSKQCTDRKQGEGTVRNCSWQLELPREWIPHHGMCKAPEQTEARLWLCEELSWAWTPATYSYYRFLREAKQGDSRVPSRLILPWFLWLHLLIEWVSN